MTINELLTKLNDSPESVSFAESIEVIDGAYDFSPSAFTNGDTRNEAGQNNGSCKIFAFGHVNQVAEDKVLHLFGDYYRKDVLENPEGDDHQNIRNFIKSGWAGVSFEAQALSLKA